MSTVVVGGHALVKVRLSKAWGSRPAGLVVEVDALRAATLRERGLGDVAADVALPDAAPVRIDYHAEDSDVYHTNLDCKVGNNIEPENRRAGRGGKKLCRECRGA